jgi:hypothetical protein
MVECLVSSQEVVSSNLTGSSIISYTYTKENKMGLYNDDKTFKQLQTLLEGKTISKIEKPGTDEGIAKFVMADGNAFRLCATELGFWIEETMGTNGYNSLDTLIMDYYNYAYICAYKLEAFYIPDAKVSCGGGVLTFRAPDETLFCINTNKLSKEELLITTSERGLELLGESASIGDLWKSFFRKQNNHLDIPEELRIFE